MPHSVTLAITLDTEMLGRNGVVPSSPWVADVDLPLCTDLSVQLGGRFLLKYIRRADRSRYSILSGINNFPGVHFLTPTAICRDALVSTLCLPLLKVPSFALVLDPMKLEAHGPRFIRSGVGIEYVLLKGFPADAIVKPGWGIEVD